MTAGAQARTELLSALSSVAPRETRGGLALVLDPSLSGPLGLVAEVREFREHGVEKIYHLLPEPLNTDCSSVVYVVRPHLRLAEQVAAQIRSAERKKDAKKDDSPRQYTLFFVPRRSMACEKVLADEGVHSLLSVRELALPLFVLEEDVLSLEYPQSFRECFHDDDRSALHACATSLARLQAHFGHFPVIRGKGECAQSVMRTLEQLSKGLDDADAPPVPTPALPQSAAPEHGAEAATIEPEVALAASAVAACVARHAAAAATAAANGSNAGGDDSGVGSGGSSSSGSAGTGGGGGGASTGGRRGALGGVSGAGAPAISEVLLLDRTVDLVTPMCTELTYEGLIHQVFGIAHGYVDLDPDILSEERGGKPAAGGSGGGAAAGKATKRELNNNDALYATIRNLNFGELGPLLNKLARGVSDGYEERHKAQTVTQIRDYMKKLSRLQQEHKSLSTHIALAERIQRVTREESFHRRLECEQDGLANATCSADSEAYIEDMAAAGEPLPSVLRLLCLLSLISNGLRPKALAAMQAELTHAYGFDKLALTWPVLSRLGMLKKQEGRSNWPALRKALGLLVEGMPEHEYPEDAPDIAYAYAGYAPLSVRLVHAMVAQSSNLDDVMKLLPGPYFSHSTPRSTAGGGGDGGRGGGGGGGATQRGDLELSTAAMGIDVSDSAATSAAAPAAPVTLVFFLGGCTYSEIAALRWLGRNGTPRRNYIVATTHICTGDTLLEGLVATCDNHLEATDGA